METSILGTIYEIASLASERGSLFGPGHPLVGREEWATQAPEN